MSWMSSERLMYVQFVGNKAKDRISKQMFQENKVGKFSEKRTFLGVFCLLETPVLRFALLPYYRGIYVLCPRKWGVRCL